MPYHIYVAGQQQHGETYIRLFKKHASFLKGVALGLMFWGVTGLFNIYYPAVEAEFKYQVEKDQYAEKQAELQLEANTIAEVQKSAEEWNVNSQFSIVIPKINASKNIIPNVDTAVESEYLAALKQGVAHAKTTSFPGKGNNIFLFAHSTDSQFNVERYNAVFYLLHKLEQSDKIFVYYADKKYVYDVDSIQIVDPSDVSWLHDTDEEQLTLQTCYPPGTTLKRLIITAKPA